MTVEKEEALSAYADGELGAGQIPGLTQRLLAEPEFRRRLTSYRLIGESLRGEQPDAPIIDIAAAVQRRLADDEPTLVTAPAARPRKVARWVQPAAGLALAASVALVAILAAPRFLGNQADGVEPLTLAATPPEFSPVPGLRVVSSKPGKVEPATQPMSPQMIERLNHYLVEHHEFTGRSGLQGPVPHASFVSYEGR